MKPKETHHVNEEDSDCDDEDDMADIRSKKTARKFTSKNYEQKREKLSTKHKSEQR